MLNFEFYSPTKFVFGRNAECQVGEKLAEAGVKKVLLHSGGSSAEKSGLLARVRKALEDAHVKYCELSGVVPNPRLSLVQKGVKICREEDIDCVLAVGGGSVADSAKAIALGVPHDGDVWDFYSRKAVPEKALKIAVVITLAATGSEASNSAVITNDVGEKDFKTGVNTDLNRPFVSFMNPELTFTLPAYQLAAGATDIISHCLERYISNSENVDLTDRMTEAVIQSVLIAAPQAVANPEDYESHATLMWAGTIAHNNVLGVGREQDWSSHQIEHAISSFNDVTHGAGLAVVFPAFMEYTLDQNIERYFLFATRVMGVPGDIYRKREVAYEGIQRFKDFLKRIGMPVTLGEIGVNEADLEAIISLVRMEETLGNFCHLKREDIRELLLLAK